MEVAQLVRVNIAVRRELGIPLTTQVHDQIVAAISKGDLHPGDRLPTIRQLAEFLNLNRNTIAQAYRLLENGGYVVTRAGGGTTVADGAATRSAVRVQELHQMVRDALRAAEHNGFTANEFADAVLYEAAQWQAMRHAVLLVVDEYEGELDYLCREIRYLMPGATVRGLLLPDLLAMAGEKASSPSAQVDFALVPFYCLDQARAALNSLGIPALATGIGPSVASIRRIAEQTTGRQVVIVCSEPAGSRHMERALRHAGIVFTRSQHAHLGQSGLPEALASADVIIASHGSANAVQKLRPDKPVIVYSELLSDETLAINRRYAEMIKNDPARVRDGH